MHPREITYHVSTTVSAVLSKRALSNFPISSNAKLDIQIFGENAITTLMCPLFRNLQTIPGAKARTPSLAKTPDQLLLRLGRYSGEHS